MFWCDYHQLDHDGEPYITLNWECEQHGTEQSRYCKRAATWLGLAHK